MAKIFGSLQLPPNFATDLLNCEIELELQQVIPENIVFQVLQLYSKGMEYFQSIQSYKYMYFERKMNSLLRSSKIISSMNQKLKNSPSKSTTLPPRHESSTTEDIENYRLMKIKQSFQKMQNQLMDKTSYLTSSKIKMIISENQMKFNEVKQSILGQLSQQEKRLQLKIQRRRFRKDLKFMSMIELGGEKSTRESLFNQSEKDRQEKIQADFSQVIMESEEDIDPPLKK